jgi:hypothetical protein
MIEKTKEKTKQNKIKREGKEGKPREVQSNRTPLRKSGHWLDRLDGSRHCT